MNQITEWSLRLQYNHRILRDMSDHLYLYSVSNYSEVETYYVKSIHTRRIPLNDSVRAYYRLQSLLRLTNSALALYRQPAPHEAPNEPYLLPASDLFYGENRIYIREDPYDWYQIEPKKKENEGEEEEQKHPIIYKAIDIQIQELSNPFDPDPIVNSSPTRARDDLMVQVNRTLDLAANDPLVRENLLFYLKTSEDPLYMLINVYRILDTVIHDLKDMGKTKLYSLDKIRQVKKMTEKFNTNGRSLTQFMNNRSASGILARHGYKPGEPGNPPTFREIIDATGELLRAWIDIKLPEQEPKLFSSLWDR